MTRTTKDRTTALESTEKTANNENVYKHRMKIMSNSKDIFKFYIAIIGILVIGALFIWVLRDSSTSQTVYNSSSEITETITDSGVTPVETELISITITAIIACISGTFVIFQYFTLKNRDTIKCICNYNSIKSNLESNINNIETYILDKDNTSIEYINVLANEWIFGDEIWKEIDELEHLLYEHGKKTDVDYIKDAINVTSQMRVLVHKINIAYNILREDRTYKTEDNFNKLKKMHKSFKEDAEKFEIEYLGKDTEKSQKKTQKEPIISRVRKG